MYPVSCVLSFSFPVPIITGITISGSVGCTVVSGNSASSYDNCASVQPGPATLTMNGYGFGGVAPTLANTHAACTGVPSLAVVNTRVTCQLNSMTPGSYAAVRITTTAGQSALNLNVATGIFITFGNIFAIILILCHVVCTDCIGSSVRIFSCLAPIQSSSLCTSDEIHVSIFLLQLLLSRV